MSTLAQFLKSRSVEMSEVEFLDLARKAFDAALGGAFPDDAMRELPPHELAALEGAGFFAKTQADERQDPIFWGAIDYAAIIATAFSTQKVARLLGVDASRIRQRLTAPKPTLYGIKPYGEWLLPRFQFLGRREVPGIAEVVAVLDRSLNPVSVVAWFNNPNPDLVAGDDNELPMSPLAWLKAGHDPGVVAKLAAQL